MTDNEQTLVASMMLLAAKKAGELCRISGYPPPTEQQIGEMSALWQGAFTAFVTALTSQNLPDREPTEAELETIEACVEGAVEGAIERALGERPTPEVLH